VTAAKRLHFPCACVSGGPSRYSDPWADIARHKLLPQGTKEDIINLVATGPKTISQLAQALNLSAPSVHTHITDMIKSELLRESCEWQKRYPTERYYEPNFPVLKADDCAELTALCEGISQKLAELFEEQSPDLERAFAKTELARQGWTITDVTQFVFANIQRKARALLEEKGMLKTAELHANGSEWVYWAEEPMNHSAPE
jgi:hypothetical protein